MVSIEKIVKIKGAVIEGNYRYSLTRIWDPNIKPVTFIMLNPSTANAKEDDSTIRKCLRLAYNWNRSGTVKNGGIQVINLFAFRATDPELLKSKAAETDIIGDKNNFYIDDAIKNSNIVVLAWGNHVIEYKMLKNLERDKHVIELLKSHKDVELYCLSKTKLGCPGHPLYLSSEQEPIGW